MKQETTKETIKKKTTYCHKYTEDKLVSTKRLTLILMILMTMLFVFVGSYPCAMMRDFSIMLTWVIYAVPLFFGWFGYFKFIKIGDEISQNQYKKGIVRLNNSGMGVLLISGFDFFNCIYFLFSGEYESLAVEIGFLVRVTILFIVSLCFALIQRKQHSNVVENSVSEKSDELVV